MPLQRLLFISIPGEGGVFEYVCELFAHLKRYHPEIIVDLAYSSKRGGVHLERLIQEVKTRGGEVTDLLVTNAPQLLDSLALWKIIKIIGAGKPQIVHAHSSKAGTLCRLLRWLWPGFPPVVYMPHAYFGLARTKILTSIVFNALESILGHAGVTINCSFDEREFARQKLHLPGKSLILIKHGVDLERFHPPSENERKISREKFGFSDQDIVLASVGRQAHQKNYPPLYRALDSILSQNETRYRFVHAGKPFEELRNQLSPRARLKCQNFAHLSPIEPLYYAADAFILTSRYEGLSLSVLQALACGLKLFLTRVPGNQCLQKEGFHAIEWIEPSENETILSQRIEQVLMQWVPQVPPPLPDQISRVHKNFNAKTQYEKIFKAYNYWIKKGAENK